MATATMQYKTFPSRYAGTCDECHQPIQVGEMIAWRYGYSAHEACVPQPTAEELAAQAAEKARIEAERIAAEEARKAEAKVRAKQRREARKAEAKRLMEEPLVRYGHGFDSRNSVICGRCGGCGRYSFNYMDGDRCYGCGGKGRVFKATVAQPKVEVTATLKEAKIGDVFTESGTLYRVTAIVWRKVPMSLMGPTPNQWVSVERLVDGDTGVRFRREAFQHLPSGWNSLVMPSDAMIGKPAEQDENGQWIVY